MIMIDGASCTLSWFITPYVVKGDLELLILLPPS